MLFPVLCPNFTPEPFYSRSLGGNIRHTSHVTLTLSPAIVGAIRNLFTSCSSNFKFRARMAVKEELSVAD